MASIDDSVTLLAASDQLFDNVCGPCKMTDGSIKEAKQYCVDCSEYLCDSCVEYHKTLPPLKTHKIIGADTVSDGMSRRLTVFCRCNKQQEVVYYCEEHDDVICSPCKSFKHYNCQTSPIQLKSSGFTQGNLETTVSRTKSLKERYEQLRQICSENQKELKMSKEICKKEIKAFRKELDNALDKLEQKMLAELDQLESKERICLDQHILALTTALQMLDADCQVLSDAKTDGREQVMFCAEVQTTKGLQDYENRMADLEKDIRKLLLSFEKNEKLSDLQDDVKTIGSLKITEMVNRKRPKTVLLRENFGSPRKINVGLRDDQESTKITGCVVMPNDYVVIIDNPNAKLKLLGRDLVVLDSSAMPRYPYDVSVLDTDNVIVTISSKKQLQEVQVFPQLKVGRVIQLDIDCWGVEVSGDKIYVSCRDNHGGEVLMLDKLGNKERRLNCSWKLPINKLYLCITVSKAGDDKIFLSDGDTVTCMSVNGSVIYNCKDTNLRVTRGLLCDDSDNILVCCQGSKKVQLITAEGKLYETVLSLEGDLRPYSVAYRYNDNILIVGGEGINLLVCHILK